MLTVRTACLDFLKIYECFRLRIEVIQKEACICAIAVISAAFQCDRRVDILLRVVLLRLVWSLCRGFVQFMVVRYELCAMVRIVQFDLEFERIGLQDIVEIFKVLIVSIYNAQIVHFLDNHVDDDDDDWLLGVNFAFVFALDRIFNFSFLLCF